MYILYNSNIREMKTFTFYDALSKSYCINVLMQIFFLTTCSFLCFNCLEKMSNSFTGTVY